MSAYYDCCVMHIPYIVDAKEGFEQDKLIEALPIDEGRFVHWLWLWKWWWNQSI